MANLLTKTLSPQSTKIYNLLLSGQALSAKDIGKSLKIFPNAVYRSVKQLIDLGLAEEVNEYPIRFKAKAATEALDMFSSLAKQSFQETFGIAKAAYHGAGMLPISFVQRRKDLLKMTSKDSRQAKEAMNYIVSGLEVPADTILANKRAVDRGVKVRLLVQNLNEVTPEKLKSWQQAGVGVRYFPNMEARIFIFDHKIVYFTSYDPSNIEEAVGVRFAYAPYAKFMDELFEQRWKMGKEIKI